MAGFFSGAGPVFVWEETVEQQAAAGRDVAVEAEGGLIGAVSKLFAGDALMQGAMLFIESVREHGIGRGGAKRTGKRIG